MNASLLLNVFPLARFWRTFVMSIKFRRLCGEGTLSVGRSPIASGEKIAGLM
jgi:hypothetical protein